MSEKQEQHKVRLSKRERMFEEGNHPYKERFERTHLLKEAAVLDDGVESVSIAGRLIGFRSFGKPNVFQGQMTSV